MTTSNHNTGMIRPVVVIFVICGLCAILMETRMSTFMPFSGSRNIWLPASFTEQPVHSSEQSASALASISVSVNDTLANIQARLDTLEGGLRHVKMSLLQVEQPSGVALPNNNNTTTTTMTTATTPSSTNSKNNPLSNQLPTCDELMNRPDSPVANGEFLTRQTTPNTWTLRADGSRQLELPFTCRLKQYTSTEARQCFAKRHLSFIGDSITRYQYLSLAYFIERGQYPPRFGRAQTCTHIDEQGIPTCSAVDKPNVCMEGDWTLGNDGWQDFQGTLGGSTDGGPFHGRFECPCSRRVGSRTDETIDNGLYVSAEDEVTGTRVKISYISEIGFGDLPAPIQGWNFTTCAYNGTCQVTKDDSEKLLNRSKAHDWDWNETLDDALNGTLQSVLPPVDIVIYNRGLWGVLNKDMATKIMPLLHELVGDGRCMYRTTTAAPIYDSLWEREMQSMKDATYNAGCSMIDFGHITKEFWWLGYSHPQPPVQENGNISNYREWQDIYWDAVHFRPWVYEELNNLLLNILCNSNHGKSQ